MNQQAPPDGNTTTGPKAIAIISIVFAMAIMFYYLRIYTLDISDYFISGAVVSRNMDTIEIKLQANCSKRLQKSSFSLRW
jgi:hypothetical protein